MATTNLKKLSEMPDLLTGGHAACAGCAGPIVMRQILLAAQQDGRMVVCGIATGCMEVVTTIYPYTAWRVPLVHTAFENAAATVSGAEAAYRSLKRQGKLPRARSPSSPSAATAAPTTSACSRSPAPWSAATTSSTSATTTRRT